MSITNQIKTVLLLGILTGILLFIGSFFGRAGLTFAIIFVVLMNFFTYFFSDKLILVMYRAKQVSSSQAPELHKIVDQICKEAKIPKPKIFIIPSQNPNAFATGRNPKNASIAFTQGILNLLNKDELKGVAAHELSHVKNRDILIATIAATIAGIISYAAFMARFAAIFGGMRGNRDSGNIIEILALAIIAPIAALIIQLAISRSREYLADETGARLIHTGIPLANALEKLEKGNKLIPMTLGSPSSSSLFITNPFKGGFISILSTHPPIELRVKKLRAMKY